MKDDEDTVDEREICQVTDVTEEDLETTEGETVDLYVIVGSSVVFSQPTTEPGLFVYCIMSRESES